MRERSHASVGALLGLLLTAGGACAEQHQDGLSAHDDMGDDTSSSATAPAPATRTGGGTSDPNTVAPGSPITMVPNPPTATPSPGTAPSSEPLSLPAPEPFDPMHTSCSSPRASEGVWLVVDTLNHTCNVDDDCFVTAGAVSCSKECASGSLNVLERPNIERLFAAVEDKYCPPYRKANCPVLAPAECGTYDSLPRCREHYCSSVSYGCDAGCKAERPGGTCRGAELCDGCPSVIIEASDKPCDKPGQSCNSSGGCSPYLECNEKEPGVFRWELFNQLCF
jgi:hypothetical protein